VAANLWTKPIGLRQKPASASKLQPPSLFIITEPES